MIKVDMYIGIASKMLIGSIGIFILIRLVGNKAMSELTPFDLLYILILGAIVEEAIYDDKVDVFHVIFALILWGVVVYIVEKLLEKTEKLSTLIQGKPSILIEKGKLNLKEKRTITLIWNNYVQCCDKMIVILFMMLTM